MRAREEKIKAMRRFQEKRKEKTVTDKKDIYGEKWYVGVLNNRYINRMSDSSPVCEVYDDDKAWELANLLAA